MIYNLPRETAPVPTDLTPPTTTNHIVFTSADSFSIKPKLKGWDGTIEYLTTKGTWTSWDGSMLESKPCNGEYAIYMRGIGNTKITSTGSSSYTFAITATSKVYCDGNMENLLDYATVKSGSHPTMGDYCFSCLFANNSKLDIKSSFVLPTTVTRYCYTSMFENCTSLTIAPSLPAKTLVASCYASMFYGCTSLTIAPSLPATTLSDSCYASMFSSCGLTAAPSLPATTLANNCYKEMFYYCGNLTTAPSLPATTLGTSCYQSMFQNCTSLVVAPSLPATTLTGYCYSAMFSGCTSLKRIPYLPATRLASSCYVNMFYGCKYIFLSATQTGSYTVAYRIPKTGTGSGSTYYMQNMFYDTSGSFKGTPSLNTTYYLNRSYNGAV